MSEKKGLKKETELIPMPHGGAINRFLPGWSGGPGRPKKLLTIGTEAKYTPQEITETFAYIVAKTPSEIKAIAKDPTSTILEAIVAKALLTDLEKGSTYRSDSILDRLMGKATEKREDTVNVNITSLKVEVIKVDAKIARNEKELDV